MFLIKMDYKVSCIVRFFFFFKEKKQKEKKVFSLVTIIKIMPKCIYIQYGVAYHVVKIRDASERDKDRTQKC